MQPSGSAGPQVARRPMGFYTEHANPKAIGPAHLRSETAGLIDCGSYFHSRGWSLGTSSNYSVVLSREPLRLLITASGKDKGRLGPNEVVIVDGDGRMVAEESKTDETAGGGKNAPRPSAETLLHSMLARQPEVGAVLHTHSTWGTLLSDWFRADRAVTISGYEMLKGLAGITTHETTARVPIFNNTQNIPALVAEVEPWLNSAGDSPRHAFLIQRHGMYTWGRDLDEARRHVEILEFLFEVVGRTAVRQNA